MAKIVCPWRYAKNALGWGLRFCGRQLIVLFFPHMKTAFALTFLLLASCAGVRPTIQNRLAGEWQYADNIQSCHYVFKRDGTFSGDVTYHQKLISKFTGRWSVDGDTLLYRYTSDALKRIPVGSIDRDKLVTVQKDFFAIEAADGSKRRYARIQ
jgi:hypothetical protein